MALELSICPVCLRTHIAGGIHQCETEGVPTGYTTNATASSNVYRCGACLQIISLSLGHSCPGLHIPTITKTTTCCDCGEYSEWTHACIEPDWKKELRPYMSQQEEPLANNIDEQQITLLDGMRSARDAAYRYAQSKHDRATLMRIQADALEREGDEIVSEINEGVPAPEST